MFEKTASHFAVNFVKQNRETDLIHTFTASSKPNVSKKRDYADRLLPSFPSGTHYVSRKQSRRVLKKGEEKIGFFDLSVSEEIVIPETREKVNARPDRANPLSLLVSLPKFHLFNNRQSDTLHQFPAK